MKDKVTAGVLALFLGGLGAHKFYLGRWVQGILYLLLCWTFIPAALGVLEAIVYFANSRQWFDATYNAEALMVSQVPRPETHVRCPDCRELVLRGARVCKHCGCRLVPQ